MTFVSIFCGFEWKNAYRSGNVQYSTHVKSTHKQSIRNNKWVNHKRPNQYRNQLNTAENNDSVDQIQWKWLFSRHDYYFITLCFTDGKILPSLRLLLQRLKIQNFTFHLPMFSLPEQPLFLMWVLLDFLFSFKRSYWKKNNKQTQNKTQWDPQIYALDFNILSSMKYLWHKSYISQYS